MGYGKLYSISPIKLYSGTIGSNENITLTIFGIEKYKYLGIRFGIYPIQWLECQNGKINGIKVILSDNREGYTLLIVAGSILKDTLTLSRRNYMTYKWGTLGNCPILVAGNMLSDIEIWGGKNLSIR